MCGTMPTHSLRPIRGPALRCLVASTLAAVLAVAGCDGTPTDGGPFREGLGLRLSVAGNAAGGPSEAFGQVDVLHAVVVREDDASTVLDDRFSFDPDGQDGGASVAVPVDESPLSVSVEITLLAGDDALFRGATSTTLEAGRRTAAEIALEPVPGGLAVPDRIEIDALHDTVPPGGAVVFATGDTIPGMSPVWTADETGVVAVTSGGSLVSLQEGEGELLAGFDRFAETVPVEVRQRVATVRVEPPSEEVPVGRTRRFEATPVDRQGQPLSDPAVEWSASPPAVASVDADGLATGREPGTATVRAERDGVTGEAELVVTPAEPGVRTDPAEEVGASSATLHGTVEPRESETAVWFEWGTSTELGNATPRESIGDGRDPVAVQRTIAELENDRVHYVRVAAANEAGVSRGEILEFRTLVAPPEVPSGLEARVQGGRVRLSWTDESEIEPVFEVQRAPSGTGSWTTVTTTEAGVTELTDEEAPVGSVLDYRVRACSPAQCSAFSQTATVAYGPELAITSGTPSIEVTTYCPGERIFITSSTVENLGNLSSGSFGYGYFLSADGELDSGDTGLGGGTVSSLGPGGEAVLEVPEGLAVPEEASPGDYLLGVLVDPGGTVPEIDRSNNAVGVGISVVDCSLEAPPGAS